jgi:hypothetical protein
LAGLSSCRFAIRSVPSVVLTIGQPGNRWVACHFERSTCYPESVVTSALTSSSSFRFSFALVSHQGDAHDICKRRLCVYQDDERGSIACISRSLPTYPHALSLSQTTLPLTNAHLGDSRWQCK